MGFSKQEYWSGLPFPTQGSLGDPGIKAASPALAGVFLTAEPPGQTLGITSFDSESSNFHNSFFFIYNTDLPYANTAFFFFYEDELFLKNSLQK